jgi:hypothetical protein
MTVKEKPYTPPNIGFVLEYRNPTEDDNSFPLLTTWLNQSTNKVFQLVNKIFGATWVKLSGGETSGDRLSSWDQYSIYIINDIVNDDGILYVCIANNSNKKPVSNPLSWSVYPTSSSSPVTQLITSNHSILVSELGSSLRANSVGDIIFTFAALGSAQDGYKITIVKINTGKVTITPPAGKYIDDKAIGVSTYNDTSETYSTITLEYVHEIETLVVVGARGSWF